jgi:hypothetical protein
MLFWGRILFLVGLYLFLLFVVISLTRDLRAHSVSEEEAAPGELVMVDAAQTGYRPNDSFPLRTDTLVGRAPDNTIILGDDTVSGHHGRLRYRRDRWEVEDTGSRNGVRVNGRTVKQARVEYGDVVHFGSVVLKLVRSERLEGPATPSADG